jgi:hypothetical protein
MPFATNASEKDEISDTDIDITARGAIGVDCVEKADPLVCSRSNDTGPVIFGRPIWLLSSRCCSGDFSSANANDTPPVAPMLFFVHRVG